MIKLTRLDNWRLIDITTPKEDKLTVATVTNTLGFL